ncbi:MAG: hypothetical protein ACXU7D_03810 [Burkholderiaceae bacterium]
MHKIISSCFLAVATFSLLSGTAQANDSNLLGCWRTQHIEQIMSDQKVVHLNSDCISEFTETQYRTECKFQKSHYSSTYTYRVASPGEMLVTMISSSAKQSAPAEPREIGYMIDEDWLTITANPPHMANTTERVIEKINSLYVRVTPASKTDNSTAISACSPQGPSTLRNSRGPASSLAFNVPDGYEALLTDPTSNPDLASAINSNFLIGQFVARDAQPSAVKGLHALLVEDYRAGAHPVKPDNFNALKEKLKTEIGKNNVSCENQQRICFDVRDTLPGKPEENRYMTTEYVNVKGRVAIIYGSASGPAIEAKMAAKKIADDFAERIIKDNP